MWTSGNNDESSGGARGLGGGHAKRSRKQPHPQHTVRFGPGAHDAPREGTPAAQVLHDDAPPVVGSGVSGATLVKEEEEEEETLVQQRDGDVRAGAGAWAARRPRRH
jgi:hypothetical protein